MTRPLAYISAPWGTDNLENATNAANYCRQAYEAGYSPICPVLFMPTFLKGDAPAEVKDRQEMSDELLKRCRILVVCGDKVNDEVKSNIALAKHCRIAYTTLSGILAVSKLDATAKGGKG
jgi:hypothetical protein